MLISTTELNSILNDPNVIIADTRSFKDYSEGHIPGSVHLDLFAFHWIDTTQKGIENFNNQTCTIFGLARMEALENGYDEAIMLNSHGKVAEGSAENIFIIKDDIIQTPPLSAGGLEGITRDSIIQIIEENGGFVVERDLERDDLYAADEIFMTGTAAEVKSVTQIDKVKIGNGKMGSITKALQKSFTDIVMGKDERFLPWLTFI